MVNTGDYIDILVWHSNGTKCTVVWDCSIWD